MGTFSCFEEIEAWQKARELVNGIYSATDTGAFAKDYALKDQIRSAGISVMSNIAEGFERGGTKEFIQFLSIAKGSAGEARSQIYIASDQGYISEAVFKNLHSLMTETSRMLSGLMSYLRKSKIKGNKYK